MVPEEVEQRFCEWMIGMDVSVKEANTWRWPASGRRLGCKVEEWVVFRGDGERIQEHKSKSRGRCTEVRAVSVQPMWKGGGYRCVGWR